MLKALKLDFLAKYQDFGLLVLRIGLGATIMMHGWPKLVGGPEVWQKYGGHFASAVGMGSWPESLGFMANVMGLASGIIEFGGGALLILGLLMRPAAFFLFTTMVVAVLYKMSLGGGFMGFAHAMEVGIVFFALIFIGPGKYSLDSRLR